MSVDARSSPSLLQGTGRYRVEAELARGGMGVVYRVWDRAEQRHKALKRELARGGKPASDTLEREYRTLISLKHPSIIAAQDFGVDAEGAYYTMELLDGADLRARSPVPFQEACAYLRDVASSLALLHARGLLHRDVSPLNVRITSRNRAKLLDFGALASFGRQTQVVGTASCIAPEVLDGAELDQRVDLFALGVTAYFALTGRMAYAARSIQALPQAWADGPPAPPSHFAPEIPAALDELVMSLIALDPLARPRTAAEVIDRLGAMAELAREDEEAVIQSYLRHPALVGRAEVRARLSNSLRRLREGSGGSVLIEAGPGMGKSAQLADFEREARFAGVLVLDVNARAHKAPASAARALLQHAQLELGLDTDATEHAPTHTPAPDLVAELCARFAVLAGERPLLLSIDDADHADAESAAVLAQLAKQAPATRILIALSASSEEVESQVGLRPLRRAALRLQLPALSAAETEQLARSIFGEVPDLRRLSAWLATQASGSPMIVMELLTELIEQRRIRYDQGTWQLPQELPSGGRASVTSALERRLTRLGEAARALSGCLSAVNRAVSREDCAWLTAGELSMGDAEIAAALDELVREGVLVGAGEAFAFAHAHLRDLLHAALDAPRRQRLHRRVAEHILAQPGLLHDQRLEAAYHYALAGDAALAERWSRDVVIARHLDQVMRALPTLLSLDEHGDQLGLDEFDKLRFTYPLLIAGPYMDASLHARFAQRAMAPLEKRSGMYVAARLYPLLGSTLAMLIGILLAYVWHLLTPKRKRWEDFRYPLAYFGGCASLAYQATLCLDRTAHGAALRRLEPVRGLPLSSPARFVYEGVASQGLYLEGRLPQLPKRTHELLQEVDAVRDMDEGSRSQYKNGVRFWGARREIAASGEEALAQVAALLQSPVNTDWIMAEFLRSAYHLSRGEVVQAEQAREALDALTARYGQNWSADMLLALEFPSYHLTGDVVGLKRCVQHLETLVEAHASLRLPLAIARAMHEGHRGRSAHALQLYESMAEQVAPFTSPFWSHAQAHWAECLNERERHQEALDKTRAALVHVGESATDFCYTYEQLTREQATALSGLGRHEEAAALLDGLLARHAQRAQPLLAGLLHRDRARVALRRNDADAFAAHSSAASAQFAATQNPALRAQLAKLLDQALSRGFGSELGGFAKRQMAEALELKAALAERRSGKSAEQKLLDYAVSLTGANRARLYLLSNDVPTLSAQHGTDQWPASVAEDISDLVGHYLGNDGMTTVLTEAAHSLASGAAAHKLLALTKIVDDRRALVGVLVLADAPRLGELTLTRLDLFAQTLAEVPKA